MDDPKSKSVTRLLIDPMILYLLATMFFYIFFSLVLSLHIQSLEVTLLENNKLVNMNCIYDFQLSNYPFWYTLLTVQYRQAMNCGGTCIESRPL